MPEPIQVLLVEDNPADVDLTREALASSKLLLNLSVASDGEQCIDFLESEDHTANPRPDLVFLDLNLPRLSGRDVLAHMKSSKTLCTIPVVVLTSSDAEVDIAQSYGLGANCYITKPVDLSSFLSIVSMVNEFWFSVVKLPPRTVQQDKK